MARFDLSDEERAVVEPLLPNQGRGPKRKDDRKVLNHFENGSPGYPVTPIVRSGNNLSALVSLTVLT